MWSNHHLKSRYALFSGPSTLKPNTNNITGRYHEVGGGKMNLTCPTEGSHGLHHSSPQVKGSSLSSVPYHGILPGDIVDSHRVTGELKQYVSK